VASIILKFEEVCCVERWKNLPEIHSGLYSRGARQKPLFSKEEFRVCQKAPKYSQTMRNEITWSDEIKLEVFGLNVKRHVWRKPGTTPMVKHGGGSIMLCGCFCAKLIASYPRRLEAVIAAKGASTKYRVKGLNTYRNVLSVYHFLMHLQKCINLFLLCNYRVLCVD
jgi:hypothetical protein